MLFLLLYKIGEQLTLALPVALSYKIAAFIADIKYLFSFRERREMYENLKVMLPGETAAVLKNYSRQIFENFSRYLVDFLRFRKLNLKYIEEHVEIQHRDYVDEALKKGKGAVLLAAHLGSWELGGAVMGILGYPMNVVALAHKNKFVNNFFIKQRHANNEKIIFLNHAVKKCLSAFNNNELIAIVGDKNYSNTGVTVKFFGMDTSLPKGPALLSLKTGAAIIPSNLIRTEGDNFRLIFEGPIKYLPSGDFDVDILNLTALCAKHLEASIRRYPAQWYCFRRFWLKQEVAGA